MKILVYCPLNPNPPKLWRRTAESIHKLQWAGPLDVLFAANDNPHTRPYDNITHQYNKARELALYGGYDALLCVESDMIVPPETLIKLAACDGDVAYALYVFRHGWRKWSAYTELEAARGVSISDDLGAAAIAWGRVLDVAGVGLGCTLIKRRVLETLVFHLTPGREEKESCDWAFALDCQLHGFTQHCDLSVVCGHQSYKPWPRVLWPDPTAHKLVRMESLDGVKFAPTKLDGLKVNVGFDQAMIFAEPQ